MWKYLSVLVLHAAITLAAATVLFFATASPSEASGSACAPQPPVHPGPIADPELPPEIDSERFY